MKLSIGLSEVRGAASLCIKCTACTYSATSWPENHDLCPIYSRDNCFAYSGGGLLYMVKALVDRKIEFSQNIAELALACTSCGACKCGIIRSHTPNADPLDIIRLLRYESAKRGFIPQGRASQVHEECRHTGDYGRADSLQLPDKIDTPKAKTVLFAECVHTKSHQKAFDSAASLLGKMGQTVSLFKEKGCCGSTQYDLGFWDNLTPLVEAHWNKMKALKNKEFVFLNPHCQEFVVKRYPEILAEKTPIRNRHITELLADAFKQGRLKSKKGAKLKVSFHDPCYLSRELGIHEAPRQVLKSLKGITVVEMTRNRQNTYCCGARGVGNYFPNMAAETARERLAEFRATDADLLITACSYCQENFRQALPEEEKAKVKDLIELVDERTG
jgi:Fe-S oxidoreductase